MTIFFSPLYYMSAVGQLQLCYMFSSLWSPGGQRSTLGLKASLHILLAKVNNMAKADINGKSIPPSERAPKGGAANILKNKTTFPTL